MKVSEYLNESIKSGNEGDLCRGWDYLKANITPQLKRILDMKEYWELKYNSAKIDFIIDKLSLVLNEEQKKQLGSFVYIYNVKRREEEQRKEEQDILNMGYVKIYGTQKELDGRTVTGIFKMSKLGIMGSFDKLEEHTGTLKWSEAYDVLFFMPKRHRKTGMMIRDFAFIKVGN